jgi:hypothetical protein
LIRLVRSWRWWNRSASARCDLAVHPADHLPRRVVAFLFDRDTQPGAINTHPALDDGTDEEIFSTDRRRAGGEDRERGGT